MGDFIVNPYEEQSDLLWFEGLECRAYSPKFLMSICSSGMKNERFPRERYKKEPGKYRSPVEITDGQVAAFPTCQAGPAFQMGDDTLQLESRELRVPK